ncbi:hypothetical protein GUJ93_ZPchr0003g18455 [Zizania palustris]|uniref:Uncharacterized protein n=1 Tax=Zizania palustris TaxID=103762 RepID=A0A8J5S7W5_ZIZPA|nr:hypothetical protein GUJ93_ZPchr0003g18455 [Zizania palustris]
MGSLMGGWDSPVLGDENKVRAQRNKSLTKEDVEAFWKLHRIRLPDQDGGEMSISCSPLGSPSPAAMARSPHGARANEPAVRVEGFFPDDDGGSAADSPSSSRDWWTRSKWAFLNEPPQEDDDGKAQSYTAQFHVATIATSHAA